jgi:catechol 2,3-dioxygenase-like lactoylglutathione lyase family enzyme
VLTNIDFTVIYVSDQRAALDFYVGKLGFELRSCITGGVLFSGYNLHVGLSGSRTALCLALQTPGEERRSNNPIMITCEDLEKTYEELKAKGVEFTMHPIRGLEWLRFVDPDQNEFLLSNVTGWIDEGALKRLMQGLPD